MKTKSKTTVKRKPAGRTRALAVDAGSALLRDALRYRYLRKEISRDHKHHTRTCMEVEKVGLARELGGIGGMWSSLPLTGLALDKAVDAHMRRDLPKIEGEPRSPEQRTKL